MSDRISRLEKNIITLEEMRGDTFATRQSQWALRYGLLESIQIVIDLACELVSQRNLGSPASYRECIQILAQFNLVEAGLAASLEKMVGLHNLLVHDYDEIDAARLTPLLHKLDDFRAFAASYLRIVGQ
ncbi:MAG: DUF86 domain-containing protein [Spirochaeta sp.]|nr:DUF86 domain-containing protein [Spirochaeta sp.]